MKNFLRIERAHAADDFGSILLHIVNFDHALGRICMLAIKISLHLQVELKLRVEPVAFDGFIAKFDEDCLFRVIMGAALSDGLRDESESVLGCARLG